MALTLALIRRLESLGCRTLCLNATNVGRRIYERCGFVAQTTYHVFKGAAVDKPHHPRLRSLSSNDWAALCALDREVTGEDRSHLLRALGPQGWVITDGTPGRLSGYYIPAPWGIGPAVALDPEGGGLCLDLMRAQAGYGARYYPALLAENQAGAAYLKGAGFAELLQLARMVRGEPLVWRPEAVWGFINPTVG